MSVHRALRVVALLTVSLGGVAPAITTYTPPIRSSDGNNFGCTAQNLTAAPVQVTAAINDGLGGVVNSAMLTIPPNEALQIAFTQTPVFAGFCSFTFDADPDAVRGVVTLEKAGGSDTQLIYPARGFTDSGPQLATFLVTPPVRSSDGNNFDCVAQNLSAGPVQVINTISDGLGNMVANQTLVIPSGEALQLAFTSQEVFGAFCTFQFQARADEVRGFMAREDAGGSDTRLLVEATPTLSPAPGCCGDCNGDGVVKVNEILIAVNHALTMCPAPIADRADVSRGVAATMLPPR